MVISDKTVRADLVKKNSLQNALTLFTSTQGRKPSTSIPSGKTTYRQPQSPGSCMKDWLKISTHSLIGDQQRLGQYTELTNETSHYEALY